MGINLKGKFYVAGHRGMVGSALVRHLRERGVKNVVLATHSELDLRDKVSTTHFFERTTPEYVLLSAARVGGIQANREDPLGFLRDNLLIQDNIFHASHRFGVKKILFLGSSCIYPRECPQPMKEEYFMTGPLEPTNEGYALSKIVGIRTAQYYFEQYGLRTVCPMPCNLYGTNDSFDPIHSHVLSALVKKFVDAVEREENEVVMWGTGSARREFLHVEDLARIALDLFEKQETPEILNVGSGEDISIRELAELIAEKVGYTGNISWDTTKPDGMPRKCLDVTRLRALGLRSEISLADGIDGVIKEYRKSISGENDGSAKQNLRTVNT